MAVEVEPVVPSKKTHIVLRQICLKRIPRKSAQPRDRVWRRGRPDRLLEFALLRVDIRKQVIDIRYGLLSRSTTVR
jgi:hypothetical protein